MPLNEEESDDRITSKQETNAKLRESFLKAINEMNGKNCSILTYEKSTLKATFAGWNIQGNEVLVQNLKTPAQHNMESALLRTPDLLAIQFDEPLELP